MKRRSIAILTAALWAVALLAVLGLVVASRRGEAPTPPDPDSPAVSAATRQALLEARRIVVVEGPPDDDPRGISTWDHALTAWAASAIVDDLRSEGFRRAGGSEKPAPAVVSRVRTLGPKGRNPASPIVSTFHADALVFVAVRSLRTKMEGADALICDYEGKGWLRLPGDGSKRKLAWDRSGHLRTARSPGGDDPVFQPVRGPFELAKRWGVELVGPDLAARLDRARGAGAARTSPGEAPMNTHDIYDPPPAPIPWAPPEAEPLHWTAGDLTVLASFGALILAASALAWRVDATMAFLILLGGALVIVESWFTALGFLHQRPMEGLGARWKIFLAALVPWLLGLGLAAALMIGLFYLSDRAG